MKVDLFDGFFAGNPTGFLRILQFGDGAVKDRSGVRSILFQKIEEIRGAAQFVSRVEAEADVAIDAFAAKLAEIFFYVWIGRSDGVKRGLGRKMFRP